MWCSNPRSGRRKNLLEHPAHGENRRAGIDLPSAYGDLTHLAARCGGALQYDDVLAPRRQQEASRQAANSRSDDDDRLGAHVPEVPVAWPFQLCQ